MSYQPFQIVTRCILTPMKVEEGKGWQIEVIPEDSIILPPPPNLEYEDIVKAKILEILQEYYKQEELGLV